MTHPRRTYALTPARFGAHARSRSVVCLSVCLYFDTCLIICVGLFLPDPQFLLYFFLILLLQCLLFCFFPNLSLPIPSFQRLTSSFSFSFSYSISLQSSSCSSSPLSPPVPPPLTPPVPPPLSPPVPPSLSSCSSSSASSSPSSCPSSSFYSCSFSSLNSRSSSYYFFPSIFPLLSLFNSTDPALHS